MTKYRKVFVETKNITSTIHAFRTKYHCVATYGQTKKGLTCFCPKQRVASDAIYTLSLKV